MKHAFRLLALSLAIAMALPACRGNDPAPAADAKATASEDTGGSAKGEVERRRRQVTDQSSADDVLVNVIQEIVNEIAQAPRAS